MKLYKELLIEILRWEEMEVYFPQLEKSLADVLNNKCYNALRKIKGILHNEELSDEECFLQIDEIICVMEELGSSGGLRHDYG